MNNTQKTIITIVGVAVVVVVLMFAFENRRADVSDTQQDASLGEIFRYTDAETKTSVLCGTSDTVLLAGSSSRLRATFVNDGDTNIYLSLGSAAVLYEGIRLNSNGGSYEIEYENLFTGAVHCIAETSAASSTVSYK